MISYPSGMDATKPSVLKWLKEFSDPERLGDVDCLGLDAEQFAQFEGSTSANERFRMAGYIHNRPSLGHIAICYAGEDAGHVYWLVKA